MNPGGGVSDAVIVGLISLVGTLLGGLVVWLANRAYNRASAAKIICDASTNLIKPMKKQISQLIEDGKKHDEERRKDRALFERFKCVIRAYAERVIYLTNGINELTTQMHASKIIPNWHPDAWIPPEVLDDDED